MALKPCSECGREKQLRRGLCAACYGRRRHNGIDLPPRTNRAGRKPVACVCGRPKEVFLRKCERCLTVQRGFALEDVG